MEIDIHGKIPGADNFTWGEALYLPQWNIHALPTHTIYANIMTFAKKVQAIREFLNIPMMVTSWWRPRKYNELIGGATESWHMTGGAVDFRCYGISADEVRGVLAGRLDEFGIRMELLPGANWVHIDNKEPAGNRYFRP